MAVRAPDSAREFAALALDVLLARLGATARDLTHFRDELLSKPQAGATSLLHDFSKTSAHLERQGWLFGMLARELGSDVLFQRRERRGLDWSLWLVREILTREGIDMRLPALPALDSADEQSTAICAVVARCVHASHIDDPKRPWSFERTPAGTALCFQGRPGALLDGALQDGTQRLAGARLERADSDVRFFLPANSAVWP